MEGAFTAENKAKTRTKDRVAGWAGAVHSQHAMRQVLPQEQACRELQDTQSQNPISSSILPEQRGCSAW